MPEGKVRFKAEKAFYGGFFEKKATSKKKKPKKICGVN